MSGVINYLTDAFDVGVEMFIVFDSPHNAYYVGQNVSGRLVLRAQKQKKFQNITVKCKGEAYVEWTENRTVKNKDGNNQTITDHYTGGEKYFEYSIVVAGGSVGELELQPGEYLYPFNFPLPQQIPCSFEGEHGYIRYTVKAVMHRPWKFDHDCKIAFTVVAPLDLNTLPSVKEPVSEQNSKTLCCLCCKSGPLELTVELPCSGYVSGQTMPFTVDVENNSNVFVQPVNCVLRKEVVWRAEHPSHKQKHDAFVMASVIFDESVAPNSSKTFNQTIKIPAVPPSNLHYCRIIDLQYVFQVEADPGTCHSNLSTRTAITLGTVPLVTGPTQIPAPFSTPAPIAPDGGSGPYPGQPPPQLAGFVPPSDPSIAPTAPPYPDLPPPTYEESAFGGKNIKDGNDSDYTQGLTNFTPRYPVWNFDQK